MSESASVYLPEAVCLPRIDLQPQNFQHKSALRISFENIASRELSFPLGIFRAAKRWSQWVEGIGCMRVRGVDAVTARGSQADLMEGC